MADENIYDEIEIEVSSFSPIIIIISHKEKRPPSPQFHNFSLPLTNKKIKKQKELKKRFPFLPYHKDMTYDTTLQIYHYPCPCGDRFEINIEDLREGEEIAVCPSCSLQIRVIFDEGDLPLPPPPPDDGGNSEQQKQQQQAVVEVV